MNAPRTNPPRATEGNAFATITIDGVGTIELIDLTSSNEEDDTVSRANDKSPFQTTHQPGLSTNPRKHRYEGDGNQFYCVRCNEPLKENCVLRVCGCLYCPICNTKATIRASGKEEFSCNIRNHEDYGRHPGRSISGLKMDCGICWSSQEFGRLQCLECTHLFHDKCIKQSLQRLPICPICKRIINQGRTWHIKSLSSASIGPPLTKRRRLQRS